MSYIVYIDESGDDGIDGSNQFILTSLYMPYDSWQKNYDIIKELRRGLRERFGFHVNQEMHTSHFLYNKNPYREYNWSNDERQEILKHFARAIASIDIKIVNVVIDKTKFVDRNYKVLENALKYSIQRIEKDSNQDWKYTIVTDKGRIAPMRKTARKIRVFNPIRSKYAFSYKNYPVENLVEDIFEKDSSESFFIQIYDYVSYFVNLYYKINFKNQELPSRVANLIDKKFVGSVMATIKSRINLAATSSNKYGLVIYPK